MSLPIEDLINSIASFARQFESRFIRSSTADVESLIEARKDHHLREDVIPKQAKSNSNESSPELPILQGDNITISKIGSLETVRKSPTALCLKERLELLMTNGPLSNIKQHTAVQQTAKQKRNKSIASVKDRTPFKKGPPKKIRSRNRNIRSKTNAPKKVTRKKYDKVEIVLDVKRVTTLVRFLSQQNQSLSEGEPRETCPFCNVSFRVSALNEHVVNAHGKKFSLAPLLNIDMGNHVLSREVFQIKLEHKSSQNESFYLLKITNSTTVTLLLKSIYIFDGNGSLSAIFAAGNGVLRMKPGYYYEDEIQLQVNDECVQSLLVTVNPIDDVRATFDVVEQYHIKKVSAKRTRVNGTPLRLPPLPQYVIPSPIRLVYENNFKLRNALYGPSEHQILCRLEQAKNRSSLNGDNYAKQLNVLNRVEAEHDRCEFESYTIERPKLRRTKKAKKRKDGTMEEQILYSLSIKQFKTRPSLIKEDVLLEVSVLIDQNTMKYEGTVEYVEANTLLILLDEEIPIANAVSIRFLFNKTTYQLEQQALESLAACRKEKILFPTRNDDSVQRGAVDEITSFQWINIGIATNEEQMVAVRNIVNRTSFPAPYVLFGPPGTGKSSTLVEAIGQIYKLHPTANMLVVAPSNFAANEITSRILKVVPEKHVFRYFSQKSSRKVNDIDENILQISNFVDKEYVLPCYEDIYQSRIVVSTMATSGRLVQANITAKHFSYVLVDECGSAKEISSLVPIGGLATCHDEIHASIVLAGDPKQLGPVIRLDYLKQTNQNVSLLERIMKLELYEMNPTTKEYNNQYITQLRDNFRSHPMLLNFPNNTFYAGQLRAKAAPELTNWALGWHGLPNAKCPLIFHSIVGKIKRDENSFSLLNVEEAELVLAYLADILTHGINGRQVRQCDVGLISPYAAQVLHLKTLCKARGWQDVEIGSAEQYQGREKPVMIMSTVRSRCNNVGFLSDAKRLNVSITRARALLIVIGHDGTLKFDPNWKAFIKYCKKNKAYIHGGAPLSHRRSKVANTKTKPKKHDKSNKPEKVGHETPHSKIPNPTQVKDNLMSNGNAGEKVKSKQTKKAPAKDKKQKQKGGVKPNGIGTEIASDQKKLPNTKKEDGHLNAKIKSRSDEKPSEPNTKSKQVDALIENPKKNCKPVEVGCEIPQGSSQNNEFCETLEPSSNSKQMKLD